MITSKDRNTKNEVAWWGTRLALLVFLPRLAFPRDVAQMVNNLPATQGTWVPSLVWEDPLEKGKATHSIILAWRIPWIL